MLASVERIETKEEIQREIKRVFGARAGIALCIASHENGAFDPQKIGWNHDKLQTHDRGIFQLNSYWHREVSDAEAFDARANIREAYRISKQGTDWSQWSTRYKCGV